MVRDGLSDQKKVRTHMHIMPHKFSLWRIGAPQILYRCADELSTLVRDETVLAEAVIDVVGDILAQLLLLLHEVRSSHDSDCEVRAQLLQKLLHFLRRLLHTC